MRRWFPLLLGLFSLASARVASAQERSAPVFPSDSVQLDTPAAPAKPQVRTGSCLSAKYSVLLPVTAVAVFAAPVAGIAALVAHRRMDAVTGALAGGAVFAGGATVAVATHCSPMAVYTYLGTPFAATLGALVGGVWGR